VQLDLFAHSRDIGLRNDVAAALCAEYPDDRVRRPAEVLLEALAVRGTQFADHDQAAPAVQFLDEQVAPVAGQIFDEPGAHAWMEPLCRALASRLHSQVLRRLLDEFESGFEPASEVELAWFPVWALVVRPELAPAIRETQAYNGAAPERTARLVADLLALERQGRHADVIDRRKRLRELHGGLFARYMATR